MDARAFDRPVYLKDGKYLVHEIASVGDAINFLLNWPEKDCDLIHEVTMQTCIMAHDGLKPIAIASDAMRAFGKKKGILEKEPAVQPWTVKSSADGRATVYRPVEGVDR